MRISLLAAKWIQIWQGLPTDTYSLTTVSRSVYDDLKYESPARHRPHSKLTLEEQRKNEQAAFLILDT